MPEEKSDWCHQEVDDKRLKSVNMMKKKDQIPKNRCEEKDYAICVEN